MKQQRSKVKIDFNIDENGCFICTSHPKGKWGHAMTSRNNVSMGVYRLVYIECFGEIQEGLQVRHKCDNGSCINPEHLELGTDQQNKDDMVKRGRSRVGDKHHNVKITSEIAYFIKNDVEYSAKDLAEKYGIQVRQVMRIRSGERWGHIQTEKTIEELRELRNARRIKNFTKNG